MYQETKISVCNFRKRLERNFHAVDVSPYELKMKNILYAKYLVQILTK
ncbi:hypothetical protein EU97_0968 [Prochlorococcus marinus str. MIT 9311]|nr:hypothetical protein EU97_0968 [Prochlorococcus marinus str. MIT 9311]